MDACSSELLQTTPSLPVAPPDTCPSPLSTRVLPLTSKTPAMANFNLDISRNHISIEQTSFPHRGVFIGELHFKVVL